MKNNQLLFKKIFIFTVYTRCQNIAQRPETSHFFFNNGFFFFQAFFISKTIQQLLLKPLECYVWLMSFFLRRISEYPKILSVKIHIKGGIVKNIQTDCSSFHLKFQRRVYNAGSIFGISELKSVFYIPFFFFLRHFRILWLGIFFHSKPHKKFTIFLS